jgi:hypothetical protein
MFEALGLDHPAQPSTALDFPPDDLGEDNGENPLYEPTTAATPDPIPPAPRSHRKKAAAAPPTAPVKPEPIETPPDPTPPPARDLPATDVLKAIVTQAVRLAQKKEGPVKILELLPDFKIKTGLGFVMEATDAHRDALFNLILAAGLEPA